MNDWNNEIEQRYEIIADLALEKIRELKHLVREEVHNVSTEQGRESFVANESRVQSLEAEILELLKEIDGIDARTNENNWIFFNEIMADWNDMKTGRKQKWSEVIFDDE